MEPDNHSQTPRRGVKTLGVWWCVAFHLTLTNTSVAATSLESSVEPTHEESTAESSAQVNLGHMEDTEETSKQEQGSSTSRWADEITVTAQKRSGQLHEIPVAVTALGSEDLERLALRASSDIALQEPNFEIKSSFNTYRPTIFMRGVGANDFYSNSVTTVGMFFDGVYMLGQSFQLFDLERVEILRGPQSTLYGKNTIGGAVNFISKKPTGQRSGYARIGLGRLRQTDFEGAFDMPLGANNNSFRISAASYHRDGHTRNLLNSNDENDIGATGARAQLRLNPRENLSMLLNVHAGINRAGSRQFYNRGLINGSNAFGYAGGQDPFEGSYNRQSSENIDLIGTTLTADWLQSGLQLTSITGYEVSSSEVFQDTDASPDQILEIVRGDDASQLSQEFRISSSNLRNFEWLAGAYFFAESLEADNFFDFFRVTGAGSLLNQIFDQQTRSFAPFVQATARPSANLTLTAGLRYTWERKDFELDNSLAPSIPIIDFEDSLSFSELSGDIGLSYQLREDIMIFGNVKRGFKSGGFNGGAFFFQEEVTTIEPEFLTAYELGLKSLWFENRLEVNVAGFVYDYEDLQVFNITETGSIPIQVLENASDASIRGLEIDLTARSRDGLTFSLSLGLLDSEYQRYIRGDNIDLSGNQLVSAPEWSLKAQVGNSWSTRRGLLLAHLDYNHRDDIFFTANNNPRIKSDDFGLLNGRLVFEPSDRRFNVALWAKNLTDKIYFTEIFDLQEFSGNDNLAVGDPLTYGVECTFRF